MKVHETLTRKQALKNLGFLLITLLFAMTWNPLKAQTSRMETSQNTQEGRIIKGMVSNNEGPLESASVVLKGSNTGTTTDAKGEFTFPKRLKTGDVLLVSYLGYEMQEVKIKDNSNFLKLTLSEDLVEFAGAPNSDKPYTSKRSKK